MIPISTCLHFYLHGQAECVEHDENKHHVFERRGVHHVPELVLVGVFGDVSPQGTCFQGVFNTLTLQRQKRAKRGPEHVYMRRAQLSPALKGQVQPLLGRTQDQGENYQATPTGTTLHQGQRTPSSIISSDPHSNLEVTRYPLLLPLYLLQNRIQSCELPT